jgi:serine/threonine protein kinase
MSCYRIERFIGVGGMGMVYAARWLLPYGESMSVACKVVREDRRDIPHYLDFMRQEAAIGMRLSHNHPNLVTVFDFFEDEQGRPCLAMELVQGGSVADLLDAYHRLPATVVRRIAVKALSALACLHDARVLHRDLSPDNILVSAIGEVKVSDLNLVKRIEHGPAYTQTFRGKPVYASPEAREHGPLDARSDLYSLGAILYHMLAGKPPCGDERDPDRILECSKREAFAPLPKSTSRDLAELTMGLLRSQPDARKPHSAQEALALLHRSGEPIAGPADLGGLVTPMMQRRESEQRTADMAQQQSLGMLKPGDMLVARAIDIPEEMEREVDAISDVRPKRVASSATTGEHVHSAASAPAGPGTHTMDNLPPIPGKWASERSRPRRAARFAALLVAFVVAGAGVGALLYLWLPASGESIRLSTTSQPPAPTLPAQPHEAPAESPTNGPEQRLADAPAPGPTLAHEAAQRERQAQPESHRQAPSKSSHSSTARRKASSHVVPDAKIIEIE